MIHIDIIETFDRELWDAYAPHPCQSYAWGEARKKIGTKVIRFVEYTDDTITAVFQMTIHTKKKVPLKIGYIPQSKIPSVEFINFLYAYAKKNKIIFIKFEPYSFNHDEILPESLKKSLHPRFYEWTRIIDLSKSLDVLQNELSKKTRYNIKLAQKNSVTVIENNTEEGFSVFASMLFQVAKKKKYGAHTDLYQKTIWQELSKSHIAKLFIAYLNTTPLASYEVFVYKDVLYTPYSGSSDMHRNLKAKNLLLWSIIEYAKNLNLKYVDLWGTLPDNATGNTAWVGFSEFKKGYGGTLKQTIGSYDLIVHKPLYYLYSLFMKIKNISK